MIRQTVFALLMLAAGSLGAQNVLEATDISKPNDVFSSAGDEACVIVRCNRTIPLTFSSSMDKTADPFHTELEGSDSIYYLSFPTGARYRGRQLSISSPGYITFALPVELSPKQLLTFQLVDPNSLVDAGCYREHRNKGMEEIRNMNYDEARVQFIVARDCSDVDMAENEQNIILMDSLISLRKKAATYENLLDYYRASEVYGQIIVLNPYDRIAEAAKQTCLTRYNTECDMLFKQAEFYFSNKDYNKAEELYNKIIKNGCTEAAMATERLTRITSSRTTKRDHARVLTYEFMKDCPIGLSYGSYNMRKAGGFINFNLSGNIFKFMKNEVAYDPTAEPNDPKGQDYPEINLNFGWTIKIANPVWIYFGPGVTSKFYLGHFKKEVGGSYDSNTERWPGYKSTTNPDGEYSSYDTGESHKINAAIAVSPTIGLCVKYSYFALRVGYEYRFGVKKELRDFLGEHRITVGLGLAF
ncbi:MAG: hypothetical protein IJ722_02625 [Alloprevotella sp.]|nr:hypothetical protein [Alloprevotella sp.]